MPGRGLAASLASCSLQISSRTSTGNSSAASPALLGASRGAPHSHCQQGGDGGQRRPLSWSLLHPASPLSSVPRRSLSPVCTSAPVARAPHTDPSASMSAEDLRQDSCWAGWGCCAGAGAGLLPGHAPRPAARRRTRRRRWPQLRADRALGCLSLSLPRSAAAHLPAVNPTLCVSCTRSRGEKAAVTRQVHAGEEVRCLGGGCAAPRRSGGQRLRLHTSAVCRGPVPARLPLPSPLPTPPAACPWPHPGCRSTSRTSPT